VESLVRRKEKESWGEQGEKGYTVLFSSTVIMSIITREQ